MKIKIMKMRMMMVPQQPLIWEMQHPLGKDKKKLSFILLSFCRMKDVNN
jgi:hypothetical protein